MRRLLLLLAGGLLSLSAQTTAGLTGTLTDTTGSIVPGARVTVISAETGARREAVSNESGLYQFSLLPPGNYAITVQREGFKQVSQENLRLEVNQTARIDFVLQVGAVSETVEVKATTPLLQSSASSIGQVVEGQAVADLPLNGRNFVQLALLSPGVTGVGFSATGTIGSGTRPDDMRPGTELFSNGNREQSNNFMLDGVDNNFRRNGLITLRPSVEAIREFKIQTNLFAAEQGRNPGATVNVVTKSGTNQWHASAYEFFRNDHLDARDFFNDKRPGVEKPPFQQNQFGGSLGGPIRRDRIFFFTNYEGYRRRRGTSTSVNTVPTAAMRRGDFNEVRDIFDPFSVRPQTGTASGYIRTAFPNRMIPATRFDSVTSRLIQAYPLPDRPGLASNQSTQPKQVQDWDQGDGRLDWTVNPSTTLFGRFSRQDTFTQPPSTFGPRLVPGLDQPIGLGNDGTFAGNSNLVAYHSVISATHVFSPTFLLDLRMGFGRFNLHHLKDGASQGAHLGEKLGIRNSNQGPFSEGVPIFAPANYTGIGGASSLPTIRLENTFNPSVSLTKVRGSHSFKFGTNIVRRQIIDYQTNRGDGRFNFDRTFTTDPNNTGATGDTMASFLLGTASAIEQDFLLVWAGIRTLEIGSYFQDDWKVSARLTLNLGLRYEHTPPPVEVANRWANFDIRTGTMLIAGFNADSRAGVEPDNNNFAPRFGFAYRLRQTTVMRGGIGVFYNTQGNGSAVFRLHRHLPFGPINVEDIDQFNPNPRRVQDGFRPIPPLDFAGVSANPSGSFNAVPASYKTGYALQYNFGLEQEIPGWGTVVKAFYVANLARQVDSVFNINLQDPGPGTPASRRPLRNIAPNVVGVSWGDTTGNSNYHSLQLSAERRFGGGLGFTTAYTWAHSVDNVPLQQGGGAEGPMPQDIRYRFLDRGSSAFDARHNFRIGLNYALPFGKGRRFDFGRQWVNTAFGHWQTNLAVVTRSGLPFTPTLATSVSNAGGSRPDRRASGELSTGRDPVRWFDTSFNTEGAAWFTPRQYTYGNAGRNILRGPGRYDVTFSVFKEFPIRERLKLQYRAEFFNLFNHPVFDLPNATIGSPNAGRITATVGTPRDIQFSIRLAF
jgi:carboxypeptidase family protein